MSLIINKGVTAALEAQPTATFLLFAIFSVSVVSFIGWRSRISSFGETVIFRASFILLAVSATANLAFQLRAPA